jgi:hypothetical protein
LYILNKKGASYDEELASFGCLQTGAKVGLLQQSKRTVGNATRYSLSSADDENRADPDDLREYPVATRRIDQDPRCSAIY